MADVYVEMSGDEQKLWRSYQKVIDQAKKLDDTNKQVKKTSDEAYGDQATSALAKYAAGFISVSAAIGGVTSALKAAQQQADELAASQSSGFAGLGKLQQLSGGDPRRMAQLVADAKSLYSRGAATSVSGAADLMFEIGSAAFERYKGPAGELSASGMVSNPAQVIVGMNAINTAFGGKAGNFNQLLSLGLGAAGGSPGELPAIMTAIAQSSALGSQLGFSQNEMAAGVATLSRAPGSPEAGGTLMTNFVSSLRKHTLRKKILPEGLTLDQYVSGMMELEAKGQKPYQFLGQDMQAQQAYGVLKQNRAFYGTAMSDIQRYIDQDIGVKSMQTYQAVPEMVAAREQRMASARAEMAGERAGVWANMAQAVSESRVASVRRRGGSEFDVFMEKVWNVIDRFTYMAAPSRGEGEFGDERYVRANVRAGMERFGGLPSEDVERFKSALEAASSALEGSTGRARAAHHMMPE